MGILFIKYKEELLMKVIKKIFEYLFVLAMLIALCFYVNKNIVIKGLYMDDLFHWSWFRGLNLFDFAFKFYEASRYRPIFEAIQYLFYTIIDTDIFRFSIINKVYNALIALFIYHFVKKVDAGRIIAIIMSALYLISHYAYYQIGQGIGSLEADALLFSLVILYFCLKLVGAITKKDESGDPILPSKIDNIKNTIIIFIMFIIVSFTHERYLGTAVPIVIAILMSRYNEEKVITKEKIISLVMFLLEILLICYIRYIAIGKVMPAGTGGTYVEDTFSIIECLKYCFSQVAIILGINIGPDYLYGIDFVSLPYVKIKYLTFVSIGLILVFICVYILFRFKYKSKKNLLAADLIFLSFIAVCIGASSVTIRVELRFVYVSFTATLIYLSYMYGFIVSNINVKVFKFVPALVILLIVLTRVPIELVYRTYYPKIHCFVDLARVNSLYDITIGKYGVDDILHKKKIYIINKYYGMTNFYAEYFYKIYDKDNVGNKIILVDDASNIPSEEFTNKDTIIIYEDLNTNLYNRNDEISK